MCGRYKIEADPEAVAEQFGVPAGTGVEKRYNLAPTQQAPVVRTAGSGPDDPTVRRELALLRWGLVPAWAKDPSVGSRMINARAETVADKPAFRHALRRRRCLVPADGFYEWRRDGGRRSLPFLIRLRGGGLFAFAGLWERWQAPDQGPPLDTFTVLTTTPNALMATLHDRMPVILDPALYDVWLSPGKGPAPDTLARLLAPFPPDRMEAWPVSTRVNSPANEGPDCAAPFEGPAGALL